MKRNAIISVLILLIFLIAGVGAFSGCDKANVYTINFDIGEYEINALAPVTVAENNIIEMPSLDLIPTDGYYFAWYTDSERTELFDINAPLSSDVTLYLGEEGKVYYITYTGINSEWFNILELPTQYKVGANVTLPEPFEEATTGYYTGNWYSGINNLGYTINETIVGNIDLTFIAKAIPYDIVYTNVNYIGAVNYTDYVTNPNPEIYKATDGVVTLSAPTINPDCPLPVPTFSHWVRVGQIDHTERDAIETITEIDSELVTSTSVFIRAIWIFD